MAVALRCDAADGREFAAAIRGSARSILHILERGSEELSIVFTTDAAIQRLNREFRDKDKPTDVLSFPQLDDDPGSRECKCLGAAAAPPVMLGDVVISIATALRQAQAMGISPALRLRSLLIHGLLHLLGYDHERSPAEARRMFARERELAEQLDIRPSSRRRRPVTVT